MNFDGFSPYNVKEIAYNICEFRLNISSKKYLAANNQITVSNVK